MTKAAVSGGVTFCAESENLYGLYEPVEELFCDVGKVLLAQASTLDTLQGTAVSECAALKMYMFSPTSLVSGVKESLEKVFALAETSHVPLLVDPSCPDTRMLFMASPCRHLSLEEREAKTYFPETSSYASAYAEDIDPTSLSDSESDSKPPQTVQSAFNSPGLTKSPTYRLMPRKLAESNAIRTPVQPFIRELNEFPYVNIPGRRSPPKYKTLIEDIEYRITLHVSSIKELNRLEMLAYTQAGTTTYSSRTRRASAEVQGDVTYRMHRPLLRLRTQNEVHTHELDAKDQKYAFFLANHPDHWESNGVERVLRVLRKRPLRSNLHFCNLSSALSVSKLLSLPKTSNITCETCPHYLFFSANEIADCDTRMKTLPPIRSSPNRTLLLDLLKANEIDLVSSHHSPIAPRQKDPDSGKWKKALNGLTSLGFSLQVMWTVLRLEGERERYLVRLAKWLSFHPAKVLGIDNDRGSIAAGKLADIVVWEPEVATRGTPHSKHPHLSPYQGKELFGRVHWVLVRGQVAFDRGNFYAVGAVWRRSRK